MKFVPETVIDDFAAFLSVSASGAEIALEELKTRQPALLPFLLGENSEVFSEAERDFLIYLLMVVWKSMNKVHGDKEVILPEQLSDAEEANWELLEKINAKRFRERLDVFFNNTTQEDLLAFLEDSLTEDEDEAENIVTREGREPIFVLLKSVIDCLDQAPAKAE